ncbi:Alpha/Beta hydrolase protein [Mycena rebaudengoi]|nr:Alpha/Beta hydrolase protein [Mycena rebaudengoi]
MPAAASRHGMLLRVSWVLVHLAMGYGAILALIFVPYIQTLAVYGHHRGFSATPNFSWPENYGLAPGKAVNLYINSADNTTLGAWFVTSERYYRSMPFPVQTIDIPVALKQRPTILFLHGKSGHRAIPQRIAVYSALSSRLNANILAVDYRGFGDSEGSPTIAGVASDARAAWDFLFAHGARPQDVLIVGHSLGTAIAALLAAELCQDSINPLGLVLLAPFASLRTVLHEYYILGLFPLFKPLAMAPALARFLLGLATHAFDTLGLLPNITSSVLIAHAEDDEAFPHAHADMLFDAFLELIPATSPIPSFNMDSVARQAELRRGLVTVQEIPTFGKLEEAQSGGRKFALLKTVEGTHDILRAEGVQDVVGRMFNLI